MDFSTIPNLQGYLSQAARSSDDEAHACAENFLLDERPPASAPDLYRPHFVRGPVLDADDWQDRHRNYATAQLHIDCDEPDLPWTFQADNAANRLRLIDPRLYLIRVEHAAWPLTPRGHSLTDVERNIDLFRSGDARAQSFLQAICDSWNPQRDKRPLYATTEIQLADIFDDDDSDWANRLRDRLGLGHMNPGISGRPVEILVMRYTAAEIIAGLSGQGHPAVPTVLDSEISPFFFPSPLPGPQASDAPLYGRTVNLSPILADSDYRMGCELLHPRIEYRPEHFYRVGLVTQPISMPLERARRLHLPLIQGYADRDDFGSALIGGEVL